MPNYLIADAELNFPLPTAAQLAAQVRAMHDGQTPVTSQSLARFYGVSNDAIVAVLRRAELVGLITRAREPNCDIVAVRW